MSCKRVDRSEEIHDKVIFNELIEHGAKVIDDAKNITDMTTPDMDNHDAQKLIRDGSMAKFMAILQRINNGKIITREEYIFFDEMEKVMEKMMEEEQEDTRPQISLPIDLLTTSISVMDLSIEELSWKSVYVRTLLESNIQVVYDMKKERAIKCQKYDIQKLQEEKIPHTFEGKENIQITVCNPMQVCKEQRELALALMHIFDHVRDLVSEKTTDRSVVLYTEDLNLKSIEILRKLGYLVSSDRDRTIITM